MVLMYDGTLATGGHDSCIRLLPEAGPVTAPPKAGAFDTQLVASMPDTSYVPSVDVRRQPAPEKPGAAARKCTQPLARERSSSERVWREARG